MHVVICVQLVFSPSGAKKKGHLHMAHPNDSYGSSEFYNV